MRVFVAARKYNNFRNIYIKKKCNFPTLKYCLTNCGSGGWGGVSLNVFSLYTLTSLSVMALQRHMTRIVVHGRQHCVYL